MTATRPVAFLTPEEIATRDPGVPVLAHYAAPDVFAERAQRLRELAAAGHPLAGFLSLFARVAEIQQDLFEAPAAPGAAAVTAARLTAGSTDGSTTGPTAGPAGSPDADSATAPDAASAADLADRPPFDRLRPEVLAGWRDGLRRLVSALVEPVGQPAAAAPRQTAVAGLPAATLATLTRLASADDDWLDRQAGQRLSGLERVGGAGLGGDSVDVLDLAAAPFIAAALQVHWTRAVAAWQATTPEPSLPRIDDGRACPCCASRPVASLVRIGSSDSGNRYLVCGLCQTQWHWVRIRCSHCGGTAGIRYQGLATADSVAESGADPGAIGHASPASHAPPRPTPRTAMTPRPRPSRSSPATAAATT